MTTPSQIPNELILRLREHVDFVVRSSDAYDNGYQSEIKRLAVSLRVLFHDAAPFRSLLAQVDGLQGNFVSTAIPRDAGSLGRYGGLLMIDKSMGRSNYFAPLDGGWFGQWLSFADWWNETVFIEDRGTELSRRALVLAIADQDGGTNVDPLLSDIYARLSQQDSMSGLQSPGESPITGPERAAIRQIVHEVLRTLLPAYRKMPKNEAGALIGAATLPVSERPSSLPLPKIYRRNDACPCGSSKRFKNCHGAI